MLDSITESQPPSEDQSLEQTTKLVQDLMNSDAHILQEVKNLEEKLKS